MSNVTGVIERVTSAQRMTRNGQATAYSIMVDDTWYGCGFKALPSDAIEGAKVSFGFEQRGEYKNLSTPIEVVDKAAPGVAAGSTSRNPTDARQEVIVYQSARNAAIETFKALADCEAIKLPAKQADKFDPAMAIIHEMTIDYHLEAMGVYTGEIKVGAGAYSEDD